jgi:hypothetical protein
MTLHVTNHQVLITCLQTQRNKKQFKFQVERLKNSNCHHGPDAPIQEFWSFYETESGVARKREFHHDIFLYHHENPQKVLRSGNICFKGPNRAKRSQKFQTSRFCLTLSPVRNSISYSILGDSLCILTKSKSKICRPS